METAEWPCVYDNHRGLPCGNLFITTIVYTVFLEFVATTIFVVHCTKARRSYCGAQRALYGE